jgi:hypothetical protein
MPLCKLKKDVTHEMFCRKTFGFRDDHPLTGVKVNIDFSDVVFGYALRKKADYEYDYYVDIDGTTYGYDEEDFEQIFETVKSN